MQASRPHAPSIASRAVSLEQVPLARRGCTQSTRRAHINLVQSSGSVSWQVLGYSSCSGALRVGVREAHSSLTDCTLPLLRICSQRHNAILHIIIDDDPVRFASVICRTHLFMVYPMMILDCLASVLLEQCFHSPHLKMLRAVCNDGWIYPPPRRRRRRGKEPLFCFGTPRPHLCTNRARKCGVVWYLPFPPSRFPPLTRGQDLSPFIAKGLRLPVRPRPSHGTHEPTRNLLPLRRRRCNPPTCVAYNTSYLPLPLPPH